MLRNARAGIMGGVILGLGRALGETMAVTMVIGNRPEIAKSLFAPGYTMASVIANEFSEATGDLTSARWSKSAWRCFIVTIIVNVVAQLLVWTVTRGTPARAMPEQRLLPADFADAPISLSRRATELPGHGGRGRRRGSGAAAAGARSSAT